MNTQKTQLPARPIAAALPVPSLPADGLRRYLQEINRFPVLSPQEELALSRQWREQGDVTAAHQLVTSHLRLVAKIAMRYRGYGLPVSDLIAEGNIGLMQAVKRFDPERGFRLATYAMWWIKAAIQEYVLRSWSLVKVGTSATQKRLFFNLRKMKKKIGAHHGVSLTDAQVSEIAKQLDVSHDEVVAMDQRMRAADVHLNSPMNAEGEGEKIDFLEDSSDNQETLLAAKQETSKRRSLLARALLVLNPREREILRKRRLQEEPATLEELSQVHGISRERVRQIEVRAFEKLQKAMTSNDA